MKRGIAYALVSAVLFGVSTPLAKGLVGATHPLTLAGLLYGGSGVGLLLALVSRQLWIRNSTPVSVPRGGEWLWLGGATFFGGAIGPVLLMKALVDTPASIASLLLNLEAVFTALLAWFMFRENFDRRIALGMLAIVAGGGLLSWQPGGQYGVSAGALLIAGACVCWALDNNLTRRVSGSDALLIAGLKGTVAALINLGFAAALGYEWPSAQVLAAAATLGFIGYGVSLALFVLALRHLGTARASAYFSIAPFFGAGLAIVLHNEVISWQLVASGVLMAVGIWLHVTERHAHHHTHVPKTHSHAHIHDAHHQHTHENWDGREPHVHTHTHERLSHAHEHYPDLHHRHEH